jgi:glycosyltransferase involved in cell wall biosynthesis
MKKISLSIVIPLFNEEGSVAQLYSELTTVLKKMSIAYEIIFVDDGSEDNTYINLLKLKKVIIIRLRKNFGQSAAMDAGIKQAKGDIIATLDGDCQNDPKDIPRLLKKLSGYQCVCGWRYKRKDTWSKKFISAGAVFLGKLLSNPGIHDPGCTLRIYKKECFDNLDLYGEMHRLIPALLKWRGYKITEIKVKHRPRTYGKSKYGWSRITKGFLDMINIWFWRKYASRPNHLFGSFGLVLTVFGTVLLIHLIFLRLFAQYSLFDKIWPLLAFSSIIMGMQFIVFGLLASLIIQNKEKKDFYLIKDIIKK